MAGPQREIVYVREGRCAGFCGTVAPDQTTRGKVAINVLRCGIPERIELEPDQFRDPTAWELVDYNAERKRAAER
jgi:hypothetical protein